MIMSETSSAFQFIHLRLHSAYSLLEGAIAMGALPGLVAKQGFPAVAITDTNNLFGALEFSEGAAKIGLQPIIGLQLALEFLVAEQGARAPERSEEHTSELQSRGQLV